MNRAIFASIDLPERARHPIVKAVCIAVGLGIFVCLVALVSVIV